MSTADMGGRCCDGHLRLAGSPAGRRSILVTTLVSKDIEQYGLKVDTPMVPLTPQRPLILSPSPGHAGPSVPGELRGPRLVCLEPSSEPGRPTWVLQLAWPPYASPRHQSLLRCSLGARRAC